MCLVGPRQAGLVHFVVREARGNLLERDARLEARERLADADMVSVSEVELAVGLAMDVESIGTVELARIAAGCSGVRTVP